MQEETPNTSSKSYHWRELMNRIQSDPKSTALRILRLPLVAWRAFRAMLSDLPENPELRLRCFAGSFAVLLFTVSVIADSNPLKLILPGWVFPLPKSDQREFLTVYGLQKDSAKLVKVQRAMLPEGSVSDRVMRVAQVLSQPLDYRDSRMGSEYRALEPMPTYGHAIRHIWYLSDKGQLLIDLRSDTISQEQADFYMNAPISEEHKMGTATHYFQALTLSVLQNFKQVKSIQYTLDGKLSRLPGMDFDLSRSYTL